MDFYLEQYRRLLSLAKAGLVYGKDSFDKERYHEIHAISLSLISQLGKETKSELHQLTEQDEGYPTPKIDVRAFIKKEDRILLVEDFHTKKWSLPGGFAEVGLSPKENIIKEVYEETGLKVESPELIAIFDTNLRKDIPQFYQYYKMIFLCTVNQEKEKVFKANIETSDIGYFSLENLPSLSKKRTTKKQLEILNNLKGIYCE